MLPFESTSCGDSCRRFLGDSDVMDTTSPDLTDLVPEVCWGPGETTMRCELPLNQFG